MTHAASFSQIARHDSGGPASAPTLTSSGVKVATMPEVNSCRLMSGWTQIKPEHAKEPFLKLADHCQFAVATMPNAKSLFPEHHPNYLGTYWGVVSRHVSCCQMQQC